MTAIFEGKASRESLEKLISALSVRTSPAEVSSGGRPELESVHWAGMLAGMKGEHDLKETATHLLHYAYCMDCHHRKPLVLRLIKHLGPLVLLYHPNLQHSGHDVRDVVEVGLDAYVANGTVTLSDASRKGIGRRRWERLRPIYDMLRDRLFDAETLLRDHLHHASQ